MPNNAPHNALRHHVSGAVARGEAVPIVNVDPVRRGPSPLSSVPRRPLTPHGVAARALASRWNALRPGSVLIPETPASARAAYVRSRDRGETVPLALSRARAELVAHAVLGYAYTDTTSDAIDAYDVNPRELARVTSDRRYAGLAGERRDAETGALILAPIVLPDGATARVYVYDDPDADVSGEAYDDGPREAFGESWSFVGVSAVVTLADGRRGEASLWGVARGHYWHGTGEAQIWHAVPDLIREAVGEAADADPDAENIPARDRATCGECGRSWNARTLPTPAGRCPWEYEHDDETPAANLAAAVRSEVNAELVRFVENAEDGATAADAAADVVQRLAFLYGVYAEAAR
jgi:hypothetical protein